MADADRKLTQDEQDAVRKWMADKQAARPCPACGNTNWTLADQMGQVSLFAEGTILLGSGFPVVVLVCSRCAFFRMHSPMPMGIIKPEAKKEEGTAKADGAVTNG